MTNLDQLHRGRNDFDRLYSLAYEELRRVAARVRCGDPSATLDTTALVHEAWLKLGRSPELASTSTLHFKRIAARAMRQLLVEAARRRQAEKHGGGEIFVRLSEDLDAGAAPEEQVLAIHFALDELAALSPRQAAIVECRFFGGLDEVETAELVGISESTVRRDWRMAKAWLLNRLRGEGV